MGEVHSTRCIVPRALRARLYLIVFVKRYCTYWVMGGATVYVYYMTIISHRSERGARGVEGAPTKFISNQCAALATAIDRSTDDLSIHGLRGSISTES